MPLTSARPATPPLLTQPPPQATQGPWAPVPILPKMTVNAVVGRPHCCLFSGSKQAVTLAAAHALRMPSCPPEAGVCEGGSPCRPLYGLSLPPFSLLLHQPATSSRPLCTSLCTPPLTRAEARRSDSLLPVKSRVPHFRQQRRQPWWHAPPSACWCCAGAAPR